MNFEAARTNMLSQQLRTCNVSDESVLNLISTVPREEFVPPQYRELAYSDMRIPLKHGQTMMTPLEEALIIQSLNLSKDKVVLEVGTGSGYLTALLASRAKHVYSLEYYADLGSEAFKTLTDQHITNVTLINGDGYRGYLESAPYDIIVMTGAISHVDSCYRPQLMKNGQMIAILGKSPVMETCLFTLDDADKWHTSLLFETNIEPLINKLEKPAFIF